MSQVICQFGQFCWIDLATTDIAKAKEFYEKTLGWTYAEHKMGDNPYWFTKISEGGVGAITNLDDQAKANNTPSHWQVYTLVKDCAATATLAKSIGGKVVLEPVELPGAGRMALIASPSGAVSGLWQAAEGETPRTAPEHHGALGWVELNSTDIEADGAFYCELFGWQPKSTAMPGGYTYTEFGVAGSMPAGGMMALQKDWGDLPSHWLPYFTVQNIETALEEAEASSGKMCGMEEPLAIDGVGTMMPILDPTGAACAFAQWQSQPQQK